MNSETPVTNERVPAEQRANLSIGVIGEPFFDKVSNRVKYFSQKEYSEVSELEKDVHEACLLQQTTAATRMTMRAVVEYDIYAFLRDTYTVNGIELEAAIPLPTWDNHVLLYLAHNSSGRKSDQTALLAEDEIVQRIKTRDINNTCKEDGYVIEQLNNPLSKEDTDQLVALYTQSFNEYMCDFTADSIKQLVGNNVVYAARAPAQITARVQHRTERQQLVSIAIAELSIARIAGRTVQITELSDMATLREHRGKALNRGCAQKILEQVKNFDIVYAEARACFYGSNKLFHNLGFRYGGRLIKHCRISADKTVEEQGAYENLNVWYFEGVRSK